MTKPTVYEVLDSGVNYLLSGYDNWSNEQVLDDKITLFLIQFTGNMGMC